MAEHFANNFSTAIDEGGGIDNSQTTFDVLSVTGAPAVNFRIKVENELMLVTGVASLTLTVTRGIEGTTAASHADTTLVTHVLTAAVLDTLPHGEWTTYSPTWGASTTPPTLGSSTISGRYKLLDSKTGIVQVNCSVTTGGAWNAGSGNYTFSLPSGWTTATRIQVGTAHILDSGTAHFTGTCKASSGATIIAETAIGDATGSRLLGAAIPVTWATSDQINLSIWLEIQ